MADRHTLSEQSSTPAQGWQCPSCGSVYAPSVGQCGRCQPRTVPAATTQPLGKVATCSYCGRSGCAGESTMSAENSDTIPIEDVLGADWELPEGFHWEYRDAEDGGGSQSVGPDGERHSETILSTRSRRAVGPWEIVRERTVYRS